MKCKLCEEKFEERICQLYSHWNATNVPDGGLIIQQIDDSYHNIFYKLGLALQDRDYWPEWTMRPKPNEKIVLRYLALDAPIPAIGCCLYPNANAIGKPIQCENCGFSLRVTVVNARFLTLCSHLQAMSLGKANTNHTAQQIRKAMKHARFPYDEFQAPEYTHRPIALAGVGMIFSHEIGHILAMEQPEVRIDDVVHFTHVCKTAYRERVGCR